MAKGKRKMPNNMQTRKKAYGDVLATLDKGSQRWKVLNHLIRAGKITSMEAFQNYNITRISARVFELRTEKNVKIESVTVWRGEGKDKVSHAEYRLVV